MKKKLISLILLCTICIGIISSVSYTAHAQEQPATTQSVARAGGWGEICRLAIECMVGFICIMERCMPAGENVEIGMCKSTNDHPCHFECGCGYRSDGTGPAGLISHSCNI